LTCGKFRTREWLKGGLRGGLLQLRHVVGGDHPVEQGQRFGRIVDAAVVDDRLALAGTSGEMVALRKGEYSHVPISVTGEGKKVVRVDRLYDAEA